MNSRLVLADEPIENLDLKTGFQIVELLRELSQETGVTVNNSTHDLKLNDIADWISWLEINVDYLISQSFFNKMKKFKSFQNTCIHLF